MHCKCPLTSAAECAFSVFAPSSAPERMLPMRSKAGPPPKARSPSRGRSRTARPGRRPAPTLASASAAPRTPTVVAVCHHCERPLQDGEFRFVRAGTLRAVCRLCHAFANIWELARERELLTEELDIFAVETEELAEELARRPLRRNLPRRDRGVNGSGVSASLAVQEVCSPRTVEARDELANGNNLTRLVSFVGR